LFTIAEVKQFITRLGARWFFPDFNNKLTWIVVGTGIGVVVFSPPVWMEVLNWLLDQLNAYTGANLVLTKLGEGPSAGFGVTLIVVGLLHNLGIKGVSTWSDAIAYKKKMDGYRQDKRLVDEFIKALPTDSPAIVFLRDHDFGGSFSNKPLTTLEDFMHQWRGAEYRFVSPDLEAARAAFCGTLAQFDQKLSTVCGCVGNSNSRLTVIPAYAGDEFSWPPEVRESIGQLNELGTRAYQLHQRLILLGRGVDVVASGQDLVA
jgi:hypothetical protein